MQFIKKEKSFFFLWKFFFLFIFLFSASSIILLTSCGSTQITQEVDPKQKKILPFLGQDKLDDLLKNPKASAFNNKYQNNLIDATIARWRDGDTPEINYIDKEGKNVVNQGIRIQLIDTPEIRVAGTYSTGAERKYASLASNFAKKELPPGSKVKLYLTGASSFDRLVGLIFYGANFEKNFASQIVSKGLATPQLDATFILDIKNKKEIYYLFKPLANAFNYAVFNKIGIFEQGDNFTNSLEQVYKLRGANLSSQKMLITSEDNYLKRYMEIESR